MSHSGAVRKLRAGAISAVLVCLKSAEPLYEPSELALARSNNQCGFERSASDAGRTLRYAGGSAPLSRAFVASESNSLIFSVRSQLC